MVRVTSVGSDRALTSVDPLGVPDGVEGRRHLPAAHGADHDPAVATRQGPGLLRLARAGAAPALDDVVDEEIGEVEVGDGVEHGDIDHGAVPRHVPLADGGDGALGGEGGRDLVGEEGPEQLGLLVPALGHGQTRPGLEQHVERRPGGQRTGLAEARDPHPDQPRMARPNGRLGEPEAFGDPGPPVREEDVGPVEQPGQFLETGRRLEVDHDRALAVVHVHEHEAEAVRPVPGQPERIAVGRLLDLDDVGSEVGQHEAGEGA